MRQLLIACLIFFLSHLVLGYNVANKWLGARMLGDDALDRHQWSQVYQFITELEYNWEELSSKSNEVIEILELLGDNVNMGLDTSMKGNFFVLNGKRYENTDDSYYLKTSELDAQKEIPDNKVLLENEIVIGPDALAPLVVLYGCENDDDFQDFNQNLFEEARNGKIRMVWRPTCINPPQDNAASSLSFKHDSWGKEIDILLDIPDVLSVSPPYKGHYLPEFLLSELDLKLTSLLMRFYIENNQDFDKFIAYCRNVLDNFPVVSASIASMDINVTDTLTALEELSQDGITSDLIGLFINGQLWRLSQLDETSLSLAISKEWSRISSLRSLLQKHGILISPEDVLHVFSAESLDTLHNNQPNRYDFHRIPGFSESVIYFNNIEEDKQYKKLSKNLTKFFTKSDFGELPAYKENWNELVFVIDFDKLTECDDTQEALQGLLRAIDVVKKGYPQRIGLLPLTSRGKNNIIDNIYHLKENTNSVNSIIEYLSNIEEEPEFTVEKKEYDIFDISGFGINKTSLLVNGLIVPFKKNSWHYMLSKIVKHDVAYVKDELKKYSPDSNISVRNILHYNSLTRRNTEYIPDNFEDSTFTRMFNDALVEHKKRVVELEPKIYINSIHTVTLVGDFNSDTLLEAAENLLRIIYSGVRFRFVHTGKLTRRWKEIRKSLKNGTLQVTSKEHVSNGFSNEVFHFLKTWLPDLTINEMTTPFVIINGRMFNINSYIDTDLWENILRHDAKRSLDLVSSLQALGSVDVSRKVDPDLIEELTALLSQLFFHSTTIFQDGLSYITETSLPRLNVDELLNDHKYVSSSSEQSPLNLTLIIDPIEERSQRLLYLVDRVKHLPFLNVKILFIPTKDLKINPIHRLYDVDPKLSFTFMDSKTEYPGSFDEEGEELIVIAHAFDENSEISKSQILGLPGVCLELTDVQGNFYSRSTSMEMFGYTQLRVPKYSSGLKIQSCDPNFEIVSFSTNGRANYVPVSDFSVMNNLPLHVYVKLRKKIVEPTALRKEDALNILLVVENEEKAQAIEFMKNIDSRSKIKPTFYLLTKQQFPTDFQLEGLRFNILKYNWPLWLRPQRFQDRELKAKKLLFLDTMLPTSVSHLLYLQLGDTSFPINDLPEISPSSVFALQKCETHEDSYWNHGYWKSFLQKSNLPFFNVSSSFIVDMEEFRRTGAGDKLRVHYQRLSQDITSLTSIDLDLLNNMQLEIKMSELTLPTQTEFLQDEL